MNRMKVRTFLILAAVATLFVPSLLTVGKPAASPQSKEAPLKIAAPSWQSGPGWARFDHQLLVDFANLAAFHKADLKLGPPAPGQNRVVFMGDSITQFWNLRKYFPGKPYINRGIAGQTTPQMLIRFRQDVIDLEPKVVVILGGTNDLAGNTGPETLEEIENDLASMAQLARAYGIRVVLCSVLPSVGFGWHPELKDPAPRIVALNKWIKSYATKHHYVYVNYYAAMADPAGGLPHKLSHDGVHPSPAGYAIMAPLAEVGIKEALKKKG